MKIVLLLISLLPLTFCQGDEHYNPDKQKEPKQQISNLETTYTITSYATTTTTTTTVYVAPPAPTAPPAPKYIPPPQPPPPQQPQPQPKEKYIPPPPEIVVVKPPATNPPVNQNPEHKEAPYVAPAPQTPLSNGWQNQQSLNGKTTENSAPSGQASTASNDGGKSTAEGTDAQLVATSSDKKDGYLPTSGGDSGKDINADKTSPQNQQSSDSSSQLSVGAIFAIIIAILVALAIVIYFVMKRVKQSSAQRKIFDKAEGGIANEIRNSMNIAKKMAELENGDSSQMYGDLIQNMPNGALEGEEGSDDDSEEQSDEEESGSEEESDSDEDSEDEESDQDDGGQSQAQPNFGIVDSSQFATSNPYESNFQTLDSNVYSTVGGTYPPVVTSKALPDNLFISPDRSENLNRESKKISASDPALESMALEYAQGKFNDDDHRASIASVSSGFSNFNKNMMDYTFPEESLPRNQLTTNVDSVVVTDGSTLTDSNNWFEGITQAPPPLPPRTVSPPQPQPPKSPLGGSLPKPAAGVGKAALNSKPINSRITSIASSVPKKPSPLSISVPSFMGPPSKSSPPEKLPSENDGESRPVSGFTKGSGIDSYYSTGSSVESYEHLEGCAEFSEDGGVDAFVGII